MTFSLAQLQEEMKPWVLHNFGERPASQPLRGITEELGELMVAYADNKQEEVMDGLADCAIFMADYCNAAEISMVQVLRDAEYFARNGHRWVGGSIDAASLLVVLGKLNHHDLKKEQGIRKSEDHIGGTLTSLANILNFLRACCLPFKDVTLEDLVEKTWAKVKLRDWKKNAVTG